MSECKCGNPNCDGSVCICGSGCSCETIVGSSTIVLASGKTVVLGELKPTTELKRKEPVEHGPTPRFDFIPTKDDDAFVDLDTKPGS